MSSLFYFCYCLHLSFISLLVSLCLSFFLSLSIMFLCLLFLFLSLLSLLFLSSFHCLSVSVFCFFLLSFIPLCFLFLSLHFYSWFVSSPIFCPSFLLNDLFGPSLCPAFSFSLFPNYYPSFFTFFFPSYLLSFFVFARHLNPACFKNGCHNFSANFIIDLWEFTSGDVQKNKNSLNISTYSYFLPCSSLSSMFFRSRDEQLVFRVRGFRCEIQQHWRRTKNPERDADSGGAEEEETGLLWTVGWSRLFISS